VREGIAAPSSRLIPVVPLDGASSVFDQRPQETPRLSRGPPIRRRREWYPLETVVIPAGKVKNHRRAPPPLEIAADEDERHTRINRLRSTYTRSPTPVG
jgi:hypothetical protein